MFHHEIAIIHNHPIHYQDLLFDALAARGVDFLVLYSAGASSRRFLPPRNHAYPSFIAQSGPYEAVCRISCARRIWGALDHIRPSCLIVSGW